MVMIPDCIHNINHIIEENLADENFGPEELAVKLGVTYVTLYRNLKKHLGKTISQVIKEARLAKAKDMLLELDVNISEIAYSVGFGSATYFNRCFRQQFGISPGEYKKSEWTKENEKILHQKKHKAYIRIVNFAIPIFVLTFLISILYINSDTNKSANAKSIAILPIEVKPEYKYQAIGIGEEIKNDLSKIEELRILDLSTIDDSNSADKTKKEINKTLNISSFLKITFLKEDEEIILFVKLIDAGNGTILFSEEYPTTDEGIFELQNRIAKNISEKLQAQFAVKEKKNRF